MIVDAHCDTLLKINNHCSLYNLGENSHLDLKRLLGRVDMQLFAVFVESRFQPQHTLHRCLEVIERFHRELERYPNAISLVTNKKELNHVGAVSKVTALLTVEGGEVLAGNINVLRILFRLGVRSLGLTWNRKNEIAAGCLEPQKGLGLTRFGLEVVREMNRLGMMIDLAHISETGFWETLEHSRDPVMVSHGNCRRLCAHARNLSDEQIKALAQKQGVIGITFVPQFICSGPSSVHDVIKHIEHVCALVGSDYVGLGSDFDGIESVPAGLEDVTKIFILKDLLAQKGYCDHDIEKIMGRNFLRLFRNVLPE